MFKNKKRSGAVRKDYHLIKRECCEVRKTQHNILGESCHTRDYLSITLFKLLLLSSKFEIN